MSPRAFTCCAASSILMALVVAGTALPAAAQNSNSGVAIGPSQELSRPLPQHSNPSTPSVEHLLDGRGDRQAPARPRQRSSPPASKQRPSASPPP